MRNIWDNDSHNGKVFAIRLEVERQLLRYG
jgi:hypothetical protein